MSKFIRMTLIVVMLFAATVSVMAEKGPRIEFEKSVIDLGTIAQNRDVDFSFRFKNTGDEFLVVNEVKPSCDCIALDATPIQLAAGESAAITGKFKSGSYKGPVNQTILVTSNDDKYGSLMLAIKSIVRQPVVIEPGNPFFIFGKGMPETSTQVLTVACADSRPFIVKDIASKVDFVSGKVLKKEKTKTTIEVTADSKKIPKFGYYFLAIELDITIQYTDGAKEISSSNVLFTIFNEPPHN